MLCCHYTGFVQKFKNNQASLWNDPPDVQLELISLVFRWIAIFESLVVSFEYEIFMFPMFISSIKQWLQRDL